MSLATRPEIRFAELVQRTQTTIRLLLIIVALVIIDGLNHNFRITQYHQQLPAELYEFASKYESALLMWLDKQSTAAESQAGIPKGYNQGARAVDEPVLIHFEKVYRPPQLLTPNYTSVDSIPFLEAHLRQNLPELATGNRSFFGYQMDFNIYLAIVLVAPGLLLLVICIRVWLLRRTWHLIPSQAPRLMTDILSLRSFRAAKASTVYLMAALTSLFLLIVALLPPWLVTTQIQTLPMIRGTMSLDPVGIPILENGNPVYLVRPPDALLTVILLASFISLIASFCIAIMLIKRSAPSRGAA
jgi:hypothetical protein